MWLLETHPDLYAEAEALEKDDYSFMRGLPLRELRRPDRVARVFERRVDEVVEAVAAKFQRNLFTLPVDNELALTSCGLLCGK